MSDDNDKTAGIDPTRRVPGPGGGAPPAPRTDINPLSAPPPVRGPSPGGAPDRSSLAGRYENPTEVLRPSSAVSPNVRAGAPSMEPPRRPGVSLGGSNHTQIIRPGMQSPVAQEAPKTSPDDLVVGWLVVIGGPGYGRAMSLGYGRNSIGRRNTNRVALDYGDQSLSGENHCFILYDGRGRKYYLQSGDGVNLTYLNERPVLAPEELKHADHIQIGNTLLRFIPLCGGEFDWEDNLSGLGGPIA